MTKLIEIITYGDDCVLNGACIDGMPMVRADELVELIKPWAKREYDESQMWHEIAHIEGYRYRIIPKVQLGLEGVGTVLFLGFKEAVNMVDQSVKDCADRGESWHAVLNQAVIESYDIKNGVVAYAKRALKGEYAVVDMAGRRQKRSMTSKLCKATFWG